MSMATGSSLSKALVEGMERASQSEAGAAVVASHDEDYELRVEAEPGLLLRMRGGALEVADPADASPGLFSYTIVEAEPETVRALLDGALSPAEAMETGGLRVRSRLYGGSQFTRLLRIAQTSNQFQGAGAG